MQYRILLIRENVLERAEVDSQICNIIILKIKFSVKCQPRQNRILYTDKLCVDETDRGQHVGRQLYDDTLNYARVQGYFNITLHVWGGNDSALNFYQRMGMRSQYQCLEQIL